MRCRAAGDEDFEKEVGIYLYLDGEVEEPSKRQQINTRSSFPGTSQAHRGHLSDSPPAPTRSPENEANAFSVVSRFRV